MLTLFSIERYKLLLDFFESFVYLVCPQLVSHILLTHDFYLPLGVSYYLWRHCILEFVKEESDEVVNRFLMLLSYVRLDWVFSKLECLKVGLLQAKVVQVLEIVEKLHEDVADEVMDLYTYRLNIDRTNPLYDTFLEDGGQAPHIFFSRVIRDLLVAW